MMNPSLESLMKKADSKYSLVVAAAKRARQLTDGMPKMVDSSSKKPVTVALEEILRDRLKYLQKKKGGPK